MCAYYTELRSVYVTERLSPSTSNNGVAGRDGNVILSEHITLTIHLDLNEVLSSVDPQEMLECIVPTLSLIKYTEPQK